VASKADIAFDASNNELMLIKFTRREDESTGHS